MLPYNKTIKSVYFYLLSRSIIKAMSSYLPKAIHCCFGSSFRRSTGSLSRPNLNRKNCYLNEKFFNVQIPLTTFMVRIWSTKFVFQIKRLFQFLTTNVGESHISKDKHLMNLVSHYMLHASGVKVGNLITSAQKCP